MSNGAAPAPDLAARILQLERSQQRQFGIIVLLIVASLLLVVRNLMPGPGDVTAERFILRRPGEHARGEWSVWADGTPALRLNDDRGKARSLWTLRRDGTLSLRLLDSTFTTRLELAVLPDGAPRVALYDERAHGRLSATVQGGKGSIDYPTW